MDKRMIFYNHKKTNSFITGEERTNHMTEDEKPMMTREPKVIATSYSFFLNNTIEEPFKYNDWLIACEEAGEDDVITVIINSGGGSLETSLQIYQALQRTKATVRVYIESACSGASLIAMAGHQHYISSTGYMMIHSFSGFISGKYGNLLENSDFNRRWFTDVMYQCYKDFLSEKEIEEVLEGKDLWLCSEEVEKRYDNILKMKREIAEKEFIKIETVKEKVLKILEPKGLIISDLID